MSGNLGGLDLQYMLVKDKLKVVVVTIVINNTK